MLRTSRGLHPLSNAYLSSVMPEMNLAICIIRFSLVTTNTLSQRSQISVYDNPLGAFELF